MKRKEKLTKSIARRAISLTQRAMWRSWEHKVAETPERSGLEKMISSSSGDWEAARRRWMRRAASIGCANDWEKLILSLW